jgi:hypothetical protein
MGLVSWADMAGWAHFTGRVRQGVDVPPYTQLVEPGDSSPDRVPFHVPAGLTDREIAQAVYLVLREQDPVELVVDDRFAGALTMAKVLPLLLTMDNAVRGHNSRNVGRLAGAPANRLTPAEVTRCRCRVCGGIAFVLGPGIPRCRAGHGPMVPLSVG